LTVKLYIMLAVLDCRRKCTFYKGKCRNFGSC